MKGGKGLKNSIQTMLASLIMGLAGLGAGVFLYTHHGQTVGAALIGSVASVWFLHSYSTTTGAAQSVSQGSTINQLLALVEKYLQTTSTTGSTSPATESTTTAVKTTAMN